jgi:hypothetical protein
MSLNSKHVLTVFLHEFGHAFANLAEEYINNQNPPRGSKNCQSECSDFNEEIDDCFEGCSKTNLKRPVKEGVMRTLFPDDQENPYGIFNSNLIQEIISSRSKEDSILTGDVTHEPESCKDERYILYNNGELSAKLGCAGTNGFGSYNYEVLQNGETTISGSFNPTLFTEAQLSAEDDLTGEAFQSKEVNGIILTLPVGGDKLIVTDPEGQEIVQQSLSEAGATPCQI